MVFLSTLTLDSVAVAEGFFTDFFLDLNYFATHTVQSFCAIMEGMFYHLKSGFNKQ